MFPYAGKTALITGASSGIGAEFAHALAARGMSLILVARSEAPMQALAAELQQKHNTQVTIIPADLRQPNIATAISNEVARQGLTVDLLINNAGIMSHGHFETIDPQLEQDEIMVNIAALVGLTHAFLPNMLAQQSGAVINVASIAGFQPVPYLSVYSATKAFVMSFSIALWEECRGRNVCILALCPGTTATKLFETAQAPEAALGKPRTSKQVVATALSALDKRRSIVVDGLQNRLLSLGPRLIPRWFAAKCAGSAVKPKKKNG